ncbi:MAG: translation initiation factor IF-2 [Candidatus Omnitrophota bacterium]|jgi:translation initiation factor IF-2
MRVHELAKELKMTSKWLIQELTGLGVEVKNHMTTLCDEDAENVRRKINAEYGGGEAAVVPVADTSTAAETAATAPEEGAQPVTEPASSEASLDVAPGAEADTAAPTDAGEEGSPAADVVDGEAPAEEVEDTAIVVTGPVVVREFAERLYLKPNRLIATLMGMNIFASINQEIDADTAVEVGVKLGIEVRKEKKKKKKIAPPPPQPRAAGASAKKKKDRAKKKKDEVVLSVDQIIRPPVVTFMGHVDHGKTSLLDFLRKANVVKGEAGGITQHIGAYSVDKNGQMITFLDTPGHEAFTKMRARGANLTDIAIIVIAADEGLMPQTREAIMHAKASQVSVIAAINKMDLPGANPDKVKQQLQAEDLAPEDWGGETICVEVSATTGAGMDTLLEMILLQAEIMELKAIPTAPPEGYVIEAQLEKGRGPTASLLVTNGTLKVGDVIICGASYGKIKSLMDDKGKPVKSAGPSYAVRCMGLSDVPEAGAKFEHCATDKQAKVIATARAEALRETSLTRPVAALPMSGEDAPRKMTLADLIEAAGAAVKVELPIVLKTDVQGSMEAIVQSLDGIKSDKVSIKYVLCGVGSITENDVLLASASGAIILGFNVNIENAANKMAKGEGVEVRLYDIIYELIEQVERAMTGLLEPDSREIIGGQAEIRQIFKLTKQGNVAGCMVVSGRIRSRARARVLRKGDIIYKGAVSTLKRFQNDASEVRDGQECGIRLENFSDFEKGDIVETYEIETVAAVL